MKLLDWNGYEMEVAESGDGVLAARFHHRNLIQRSAVGESAEIVQKLVKSMHLCDFPRKDRPVLTEALGFYCDLQSLHSEDAITWSVAGTVAHCDEAVRAAWTRELFTLLDLPSKEPEHSEIALWRRVTHPQCLHEYGPEIDFSVITEDTVLLVECKWTGEVEKNQGRFKDKDQMEMRLMFLQKYGRTITTLGKQTRLPEYKNLAVLLLTPELQPIEDKWLAEGIDTRAVTWEQVCSIASHPWADEVSRYYRWKHEHTRWEVQAR